MFYTYDIFGWFSGQSDSHSARSTDVCPENLSTTSVVGELRSNWTGKRWVQLPYVELQVPEPAPVTLVPESITRRQARLVLLDAGLLDDIEAAIAAIPDETERRRVQIEWDCAGEFQRNWPTLLMMTEALGMTDEQIDMLFVKAASL